MSRTHARARARKRTHTRVGLLLQGDMQWMIAYFLFGAASGILMMHAPRLEARVGWQR